MRSVPRGRDGFTLIEVLIALTILSSIVLMMAAPASKFLSVTAKSQRHVVATTVADAQIAAVRVYPNYDSLVIKFDSTKTNTPFAGYTRQTRVIRSGAGTAGDVTRVVVTVSGPGLAAPVKRYATIAAP